MKKVLFITGASGTLGKSICEQFGRNRYYIVSIGRHVLDYVDENIILDLGLLKNTDQIEENIGSILAHNEYEEILLIHAAGIYYKKELPIEKKEQDEFTKMFQIHCNSLFILVNTLVDYWKKMQKGNIVVVSSNLVERVNRGTLFYIATKGCLESMVKQLASDLGRMGVRCNSVSPGLFLSNMNMTASGFSQIAQNTPLGRIGTSADIAKVIYALTDENLYWVNGENIIVDGGNSNEF